MRRRNGTQLCLLHELCTQYADVRVVNVSAYPFRLAKNRLVDEAKMFVDAGCGPSLAVHWVRPCVCSRRPGPEQYLTNGHMEHLKTVVDALPPELSVTQREAAVKFICDNAHVFSKGEFDIGRTSIIPYRIDTGDHGPFRQPCTRAVH